MIIYCPVWGREKITRYCLSRLESLGQIFCVVSEEWSVKMCKERGYLFKLATNLPLGMKLNSGLKDIMQLEFDYMMTTGSDNLYDGIPGLYKEYMEAGIDVMGVDKCIFYNGKESKVVNYSQTIIGAGRIISKRILRRASSRVKVKFTESCSGNIFSYQKGKEYWLRLDEINGMRPLIEILSDTEIILWDEDRNNALDHNSNQNLIFAGAKNFVIEDKLAVLDLKNGENIWKYEDLPGEVIDNKEIERFCVPADLMNG